MSWLQGKETVSLQEAHCEESCGKVNWRWMSRDFVSILFMIKK